jgi:hypothetical protein
MDIVMVHTIYIFMLYVGIIAMNKSTHMIIVTERCPGHVYKYPNPLGDTLKSFVSIEYEFGVLIEERETPKVVRGSLRMVPKYHGWFRKGLKPYQ